jgi:very-short-patch-repair endonuclease
MINEVEIVISEDIETKKPLEKTVLDYLKVEIEDYATSLTSCLENCESPIEELMLIAFNAYEMRGNYFKKLDCAFDIVHIWQQREIEFKNQKKYRVDFLVEILSEGGESYKFVVECDSFEYHSSNESFIKDRERDMNLLSMGFITIRLSGKEILENPYVCANNVFRTIFHYIESRSKS